MNFHLLPFDTMNESDVREEFLSPLLDRLGYRSGAEGHVRREYSLSLRYPRLYLGKKNIRRDPYLRGRADYILEVKGHARWVLEAKSPTEDIDNDSIEQAWTYANHPEVRGVFFAISNGRKILVFRSTAPPDSSPILDISFEDMGVRFAALQRVLGVEAIRRDFKDLDQSGEPVASGLGSLAKLSSGFVRYNRSSVDIPAIKELQASIVDGSLERGESGGLVASIRVMAPIASIQDMIQKLGLDRLQYESESRVLSDDLEYPTLFSYRMMAMFPAGTQLFDVTSNSYVKLPHTVSCEIDSRINAYISDGMIRGSIENVANYLSPLNFRLTFGGEIQARIF